MPLTILRQIRRGELPGPAVTQPQRAESADMDLADRHRRIAGERARIEKSQHSAVHACDARVRVRAREKERREGAVLHDVARKVQRRADRYGADGREVAEVARIIQTRAGKGDRTRAGIRRDGYIPGAADAPGEGRVAAEIRDREIIGEGDRAAESIISRVDDDIAGAGARGNGDRVGRGRSGGAAHRDRKGGIGPDIAIPKDDGVCAVAEGGSTGGKIDCTGRDGENTAGAAKGIVTCQSQSACADLCKIERAADATVKIHVIRSADAHIAAEDDCSRNRTRWSVSYW